MRSLFKIFLLIKLSIFVIPPSHSMAGEIIYGKHMKQEASRTLALLG